MKWGEMRIATTGAGRGNDIVFPRCLTADAPNFDRGHWLRPTVVPADSRPLSWPPIGALPRNRLAYSAAGSASAISPLHPPPAALGSLPTGAERPRDDRFFGKGCGEAGRPGGRPLRVHGWKVRCTGDYGLPSQCAHWLGNDREVGKMTWGVRGGEMGWRCELPRPGRVVAMI